MPTIVPTMAPAWLLTKSAALSHQWCFSGFGGGLLSPPLPPPPLLLLPPLSWSPPPVQGDDGVHPTRTEPSA